MRSILRRICGTAVVFLGLSLLTGEIQGAELRNIRYADNGKFFRVVLDLTNLPNRLARWESHQEGKVWTVDLVDTRIAAECPRQLTPPDPSGRVPQIAVLSSGKSSARVCFTLKNDFVQPKIYTLSDPSRLVVDFLETSPERPLDPSQRNFKVVIIDPGHGGWDTGATSKYSKDTEKDIVLDISLRLKRYFQQSDSFKVHLTRETDILPFVPADGGSNDHNQRVALRRKSLQGRVDFANQEFEYGGEKYTADLFMSIHVNWAKRTAANGYEIWIPGDEISKQEEDKELLDVENGNDLLGTVHLNGDNNKVAPVILAMVRQQMDKLNPTLAHHIVQQLGQVSPGSYRPREVVVKKGPFWVLRNLKIPSVLVEVGFISNDGDRRLLMEGSFRERVAYALYLAVNKYFEEKEGFQVQLVQEPPRPQVRPQSRPVELAKHEVVYQVKKGDTIGKIASRYGVQENQLKQLNGLKNDTIVPGQKIKIP